MDNLSEAYLSVYQELDEAMAPGPRRDRMLALANHPRTTTRDRGNIHNIAVRDDTGPSYQKKSTGGKGSRFPGYGDQGAGNKTASRMGNEPMRGNRDPRQQAEEFDLFDYLLEYLVAEGYANTNENAIAIMANMSEDWRESIVEEVLDEKKGERPRGLPYGPVGKKFRELTIPQRAAMMKRGKEHTRAAMNSSDEYSGSHAASSAIDSALRSRRLGGRG